ncbi:MAG TPA: HEAT repeat domain-containing protein [Gemmatimonadaceae bacterium]|nr:HEAT repeat domain-containing protein [Gemmatimonadaceae bacterium]
MDYSATFARHFARLISLLQHDSGNIDEQKVSLRALVTLSRNGPVALTPEGTTLRANEYVVPSALTGVHDIVARLIEHSVLRVEIGAGSKAADLLGAARILVAHGVPGDGGAHARKKLAALKPRSIAFVTPEPLPDRPEEAPTEAVAPPSATEAPTEAIPASALAEAPTEIVEPERPRATRQAAALLAELSGTQDVSKFTPEELFAALDATASVDVATRVLDDLVLLTEHCVRTGKPTVVTEIFHGVVARDTAGLRDAELKRAYVLAIRRMSKPAVLRAVASLILKRPAGKQAYLEVLERAGEEGADAVVEQINQAPRAEDRRMLVDLFRELTDAVSALRRMLGDSRWFVVRNAADLLGEMQAATAETDLIGLLRHTDDRVRRAATNALLRLGTPRAMKGIYDAVADASPEVRMQATVAIATRKDSRTSTTLIRAIEDEDDADVQLAMVAALGRVATPDAVQKLIRLAEPDGRLFRKKSRSLRVAAVEALGDAKTPAAVVALEELSADKDREVRETASRALAQAR